MFTKIVNSLISNQAATRQLLKNTLTHFRIPVQITLISTLLIKKPSPSVSKPYSFKKPRSLFSQKNSIFSHHRVKASFSQPLSRFGFAQAENKITEKEKEKKLSESEAFVPSQIIVKQSPPPPVPENCSFNHYMAKVYLTTGLTLVSTLGIGYAVALSPLTTTFWGVISTFVGGFSTSLVCLHLFEKTPPTLVTETKPKGKTALKLSDSFKRKLIFSSVVAGPAIITFPFIKYLLYLNPAILPFAAAASLLTMGGSSLYALYRPPEKFKIWESVLFGSLTGLIGVQLISLFAASIFGSTMIPTAACLKALGYLTAFQAYNTYRAVEAYKAGNYGRIDHVVNIYQRMRKTINTIFRTHRQVMDKIYGGPYSTHQPYWVYSEETKTWNWEFKKKIDLHDQGL